MIIATKDSNINEGKWLESHGKFMHRIGSEIAYLCYIASTRDRIEQRNVIRRTVCS